MSLDFAAGVRDQLHQVGESYPEVLTDPRYHAVAVEYPLRPGCKRAALDIGKAMLEIGKRDEALPWLLLVLDAGGDHDPVRASLRLPENQRYLDEISKPTDAAMLAECLKLLGEAQHVRLAHPTINAAVKAWNAGERAGLQRDYPTCRDSFMAAGKLLQDDFLQACAMVALSQWLQHMGYFVESERGLPGESPDDSLGQWITFQRGRVLVSQGIYDDAAQAFARAESGPSALLAGYAGLYRGECSEFAGKWPEAVVAYERVARNGNPELARKAQFWKYRIVTLAKDYQPQIGSGVRYWGEDRQTQGEWDCYGDDAFLLCSTGGPWDLMGGRGAPFQYRVYTTDPQRHRYFWNWTSVTAHPSLLRDPVWHEAHAANWDDGGEKYPVGTGPDLLVDFPVPEGICRLSLYLVNDLNYYEPNRAYTIYVLDQQHNVLAACPVRDFEGGAYYHFLVKGPQQLTIRIFRNLSMNVLLQGLFLDRLDTRVGAMMRPSSAYGPLEALVRRSIASSEHETRVLFQGPDRRAGEVATLVEGRGDRVTQLWQAYRLTNAYGAGRRYEDQVLDRMYQVVCGDMTREEAHAFWSAVAAAQQRVGMRAGVPRFTRLALRLLDDPQLPRERQLDVLAEALANMHTRYPGYYDAYPSRVQNGTYPGPVDEPYSLQLADEYIKRASQGQTLMKAAADILPLARSYCREDRVLGQRLFDAVGADNLGIADLELYGVCTSDKIAAVKALRMVLAGTREGDQDRWWKQTQLIRALCAAGDWAGAGTELEGLMADRSVSDSTKAGTVYNTAFTMMVHQQKDAARKWFEVVAGQFGGTQYGQLAKGVLARGLKLPWD